MGVSLFAALGFNHCLRGFGYEPLVGELFHNRCKEPFVIFYILVYALKLGLHVDASGQGYVILLRTDHKRGGRRIFSGIAVDGRQIGHFRNQRRNISGRGVGIDYVQHKGLFIGKVFLRTDCTHTDYDFLSSFYIGEYGCRTTDT